MDPLNHIYEGFWFAVGFFPVYYGLEALMNQLPRFRRMRASKASRLLRSMPQAIKPVKPSPDRQVFNVIE